MVESWRLTAGDNFFKDKFTGALLSYVFINSIIFKAAPDITLLGFRELQYVLTIISLFALSYALFKITRQFWFQPLIFTLFAFTGLDPVGMISNMSYYTYPHLFITLHLAMLAIGLTSRSRSLKIFFFILSGLFLWLISFSLPHLSFIVFHPLILLLLINHLKSRPFNFSLEDLCFVIAPFFLLWAAFVGFFNKSYIQNLLSSAQFLLSTPTHEKGSLLSINWLALKHITVVSLFLLAYLWFLSFSRMMLVSLLAISSIVLYLIVDTSLFGLIIPYYNGWFSRPMWFTAMLVASMFMTISYLVSKLILKKQLKSLEVYALVLIIPAIIFSIFKSMFSNQGILNVLYTSIPAVAAISCMVLSLDTVEKRSLAEKFIILGLLFLPFYYSTAWADWKFTYFDVSPKLATVEIDNGFGKGIRTNSVYNQMYSWISDTSKKYSDKDDFILSYVISPMVNMISKRRPSLDNPYISMSESPPYYFVEAIDFMKKRNREPRLAYIFEAMPMLIPKSLENDRRSWHIKQFKFPSTDPISEYVLENMVLIDVFKITDDLSVRCFVDKTYALQKSLAPINQ